MRGVVVFSAAAHATPNPQGLLRDLPQVALLLRRHSSLALYQLISRYRTNPSGVTERRHWREWIPVLTGESKEFTELTKLREAAKKSKETETWKAPKEKFSELKYFRRDVLKPAIDELNAVLPDIWVQEVTTKGSSGKQE